MPILVYDEKAKKWVAQSTTLAKNMNVIDAEGRYDSRNVEDCLKEAHRYIETVDEGLDTLANQLLDHLTNHPGGGGGDCGVVVPIITSTFERVFCERGEILTIPLFFQTPNVGSGTAYLYVNEVEVDAQTVHVGANPVTIGPFKEVHNKISIYVKDRSGQASNTLTWDVICGGVELALDFDTDKDYRIQERIEMPFYLTSATNDAITVHITINHNKCEMKGTKGYNVFEIPELWEGVHPMTIYAVAGHYQTQPITFNLVVLNSQDLYLSSSFTGGTFDTDDALFIDYRISKLSKESFEVTYYLDDAPYKQLSQPTGKYFWTLTGLSSGDHRLKIEVHSETGETSTLQWLVSLVEGEYTRVQPVTTGLIAWFDASQRTNYDDDKEVWLDKTENGIQATLHHFNYQTNGWIDGALCCDGTSYVEVDFTPYSNDIFEGSTLELIYRANDMIHPDSVIMDYTDLLTPSKGIQVRPYEATFTSDHHREKVNLEVDRDIHLVFVVDRDKRFAKMYIDGVLSRAFKLTDSGIGDERIYESFAHSQKIYFNSQKGIDGFGHCDIKQFRAYDRPLSEDEVLQNFISTIEDKTQQKALYDFNFDNRTTPIIRMWGTMEGMTDTTTKQVRIKYESPNEERYGASFDLPYCEVCLEGKSELSYPLKSYTLRLKDEHHLEYYYNPFQDGAEEYIFSLKADYLESSRANNLALSKLTNDCLYDTKNPAQQQKATYRNAINGFPVLLYLNNEFVGVYNFTHDRYSTRSLGYHLDDSNVLSYEVLTNSTTGAGGFNKWTFNTGVTELEWYQKDFRCRFSSKEAGSDDFSELKRLIEWVDESDGETFKAELNQYFNQEYLLRYYLNALIFGLTDSLAENLMLTTWDGQVWYPQFHNLDAALGLNRDGVIKHDVDIEMESGCFKGINSKLWQKVHHLFYDELRQEYRKLRETHYTLDNIMHYLYDEQICQIPQRHYNLEMESKYLSLGLSYLNSCHGTRHHHMRRWIRERLTYLDTFFECFGLLGEVVTIRANQSGYAYLDLQAYAPIYLAVQWRSHGEEIGNEDSMKEKAGYEYRKVMRGETVRFSTTLPANSEQEVLVYGGRYLKALGDVSNLAPSSLLVSPAVNLTDLTCHSEHLVTLDFSKCTKLETINLSNCSNLGSLGGVSSHLTVTECKSLRHIDIYNTQLTLLSTHPTGGSLETIHLPYSIQTVTVENQPFLTNLGVPVYYTGDINDPQNRFAEQLTNLYISNCSQLESLTINYCETDGTSSQAAMFTGVHCARNISITKSFDRFQRLDLSHCMNLEQLSLSHLFQVTEINFDDLVPFDVIEGKFSELNITNCPNIEVITFNQRTKGGGVAFKPRTTLDFSALTLLKRIESNVGVKGLKTLILPPSVTTLIFDSPSQTASSQPFSDIENIWSSETNHEDDVFQGVDLLGMNQICDFSMGSLNLVDRVENLNIKLTESFPYFNHHRSSNFLKPVGTIDISDYKGSLKHLFKGVDLERLTIVCTKALPQTSASHMFAYTSSVNTAWLTELLERLVHTTDLSYLLYQSSIIEAPTLPLTTTDCRYMFYNCTSLNSTPANWSRPYSIKPTTDHCYSGCVSLSLIDGEAGNLDDIPTKWGGFGRVDSVYEGYELEVNNTLSRPIDTASITGLSLVNMVTDSGMTPTLETHKTSFAIDEGLDERILISEEPLKQMTLEGYSLTNIAPSCGQTPTLEKYQSSFKLEDGLDFDIKTVDGPFPEAKFYGETLQNIVLEDGKTTMVSNHHREFNLNDALDHPVTVAEGEYLELSIKGNTLENVVPATGHTELLTTKGSRLVQEIVHDNSIQTCDGPLHHAVLTGKTLTNLIQESTEHEVVLPYEFEDAHQFILPNTKETGQLSVEMKGRTLVNAIQGSSQEEVILPYEFEDGHHATITNTKETGVLAVQLKGQTLVNTIQEPSRQDVVLPYAFEDAENVTITDTKESGALGIEMKGRTLVNVIQGSSQEDVILPYEFEDGHHLTIENTKETGALSLSFKGQSYQNILPDPSLRNSMTNGKTMQKVNEGYDSVEVVDGVGRSAILSGQTLVNVDSYYSIDDFYMNNIDSISNDGYIKLTASSTWRNAFTKFNGMLKPNTKYLAIVDIKTNTLVDGARPFRMFTNGTNFDGTVINVPFVDQEKNIGCGVTGTFKYILTTRSDLSTCVVNSRNFISNTVTSGVIEYRTMMVEYVEGMENWDFPYFTGMTSCKMPVLSTVGKNLFDKSVSGTDRRIATSSGGSYFSEGYSVSGYVSIRPNTTYKITTNSTPYFSFYDKDKKFIKGGGAYTINATENCCYVRFDFKTDEIETVQLEQGSVATPYEPYKSNILSTPEEVVLRSLPNGVCDTLNLNTGEYVRRIGEIVLDGSEGWYESANVTPNHYCAYARVQGSINILSQNILCDSLPVRNILSPTIDHEGCIFNSWSGGNVANVVVKIANSKLSSTTVDGLKAYLQANPLTVQYELATPVVKTVDLSSSGNWEKIVLDGSESSWTKENIGNNIVRFKLGGVYGSMRDGSCVCDTLPCYVGQDIANVDYVRSSTDLIWVYQKDTLQTVEQFKSKLQQNPITVWYQTTAHKDSTQVKQPIFFKDGHIQLSSGADHSLIPALDYQAKTSNSYVMDLMKTNTRYTMKAKSASGTFTIDGTSYGAGTNGTFTTPTSMTNKLLVMSNKTNEEVMILEGDVVSKTIPYFKGIKSAFEDEGKIEVLSTGKNLWTATPYNRSFANYEILDNGDIHIYNNNITQHACQYFTYYAKPNTTYTISYESATVKKGHVRFIVRNGNSNGEVSGDYYTGKMDNSSQNGVAATFTTDSTVGKNGNVITIGFYCYSSASSGAGDVTYHNVQITEDMKKSSYEPYKSNSTKIPLLSPLRSLPNGVKDEIILDREDNKVKIIQRVGEIVLNGEEDWTHEDKWQRWYSSCVNMARANDYATMTLSNSENLPVVKNNTFLRDDSYGISGYELTSNYPNQNWIYIRPKNVSNTQALQSLLSQNPITVQYELATPIITEITLTIVDQDNQPVDRLHTFNDVTHVYPIINENSLSPTLSHINPSYSVLIKPSTKYSILADSYSNGHDNSPINFNLGGASVSTTVGTRISMITTPATLSTNELIVSGHGNKINNVMVVEGEVNGNEEYFEGMASCQTPILHTVGKNLFDGELIVGKIEDNGKSNAYVSTMCMSANYTRVQPNTTYNYKWNQERNNSRVFFYDANKNFIKKDENAIPPTGGQFTTPSNCYYILFHLAVNTDMNSYTVLITKSNDLTYEAHKSSSLSLPEEVVLRGIGDVKDTLNLATGEYVQRIGSITANELEASDYFKVDLKLENTVQFGMLTRGREKLRAKTSAKSVCNIIPVMLGNDDVFHARVDGGIPYGSLTIWMDKTKLETEDVFGLIKWLRDNDAIIQYELATPIVTKINLPSTLKSWNATTHIYSEIPKNTLYPILSHSNPTYPVILKPSTKYSIVANSYSNSHTNSAINFNLGGATASTTVGNRVTTMTTPSTLSNELLTMSGRGNKLNHVMVIEGDVVGDEPYFEGMCDVKSPILSNVGENLLPTELSRSFKHITGNQVVSTIDITSFLNRDVQYVIKLTTPKNVKIAKHYSSSSADAESVLVAHGVINDNNNAARFTIPSNSHSYYLFVNEFGQSSSDYISDISELVTIELNTGNTSIETKPYKSNITTFDQKDGKTIVLRSLPNGVCDTLNVETGEYVQRIGQNTFDGSENWTLMRDNENENILFSCTGFNSYINVSGTPSMLCDKIIPKASWTYTFSQTSSNGIALMDTRKGCRIGLVRSEGVTNVDEFKTWLAKNPTTIQYELATPIITKVNLNITNQDGKVMDRFFALDGITHLSTKVGEFSLQPTLSHLETSYPVVIKPSTTYSVISDSSVNRHDDMTIEFDLGGTVVSTTTEQRVTTITTPATLTHHQFIVRGHGQTVSNLMVIEGEVIGDENYFEGMASVESPVFVSRNVATIFGKGGRL